MVYAEIQICQNAFLFKPQTDRPDIMNAYKISLMWSIFAMKFNLSNFVVVVVVVFFEKDLIA